MDERKFGKQKRVEKNLSHLPERPKAPHDSGLLTLRHDHYTIAWICRLPIEMVAAQVMLDENHESLPTHADDSNTYILGSIKRHNVAIVYLPLGNDGNVADFIASMKRTFTAIRVELMVGIGGGVPSMADVHLGDIVVGTRVMQYDLGKIVENGKFERITVAKAPSSLLETVVNALRAKHKSSPSRISSILQQRLGKTSGYGRPKSPDRLFLATYDHLSPSAASCDECDHSKLVPRSERESDDIVIHYGPIASGNQVMRHGVARDNVGRELNVVCFEMETVGLMNNLPCLLIKGISDYSDSHRNQEWQRYAAATAAAYARELLEELPETSHDSLRFEQTDAPGLTIEPIQAKACQWFLDHPDYKAWMDPKKLTHHHGFLWISGKPGAGKSTIMKFLYLHMKKNTRHNDSVIASFFFNCRGQYLERSTLGMYQSLLRQLLEGYPDLQTILDNHELVSQSQSSNRSLNVLKSLLYEAILALRQRSFICFVDGLDECDEQQVMDMVQYFEDLAEQSTAKDISFRICFSSRHYPYIPCRQGIRLTLEDQSGHLEDLAIYVTNRLQVEDQDLRYQLLSKSAGVFIWVILMVALLSKERRKGELSLRKRLAEVPSGLSELFKDILRHDCEREEELRLCILWLLCAARPLQPNEFYHALHSGLSPMGLVDDKIPDVTVPGAIDRSNRLVISSSKGLAEISNSTRPIVQFIHESVRNFLIKEKGLYELWPDIGSDWISPSHEMLKQCCNFYINDTSVRASVSKLQFEFKPDARTEIVKVYPFLEYASQYILYHANTAAKVIPQDEFLSSFPVSNWITINNLFEFDTVDEYSLDASLFYILADNGFSELIRTRLKADPESHIIGGRYRYPLFAALAKGNMDTVAALLNLPTNIYKGVDIIEDLNSGEDLKNYTNRTPLSWAAQGGRTEIFELLLQTQTTVNDVDWEGRTPLSRASENGHEAVVRLAIDKGADVNANDKNGLTPLLWASQNGHDKVVRLLIDGGADVHNAKIMETAVAATATSELNRRAVLRLFLDRIGDEVIITEAVAIAAVSNSSNGRALLELLLDRKGDEVIITEAVAIAAVSNRYNGRALLELLLDRKGDEIIITEAIAIAAVSNSLNGQALLELLLDRRGDEIIITEAVAIAAVSNSLNGRGLLELLLDRKGDEIIITEAIAIAAVSNSSDGQALLELLLDRRGDEVNITDKILRVAAENFANRDGIIKLLLDRKGNDIKITDGIVQVGAVNEAIGNIGPKKDEKSTQIFSSVGKGLDPFTEGTPFFRGSLAPNSSNYVSDQIFSAEQRSTLNTQRASLSDVEDLQTAYSDTLTMNHSVKEIYIDKLVRELLKHFSPFQMDRSSMRRITDAMPDCLKAFSLRLGSNELSQHVHREVPAFIRKYRQ
ncbi:Pfs NACHT and ankyrin domain protein [Penicillium macrosclerotiorum]|uniref:Pfs NACHT and ankyrin domain protein n=1 Tax=Penicillium macrosclerotiorum TaxID=303699 RepID=UPI002548EA73|nr:Pfs NACHT and ankyrin domain protein [Penicillium macrosclerotiorum]KAJ5675531.1 Pfs NACHT and ankyrin domain protein [Penicillium macrosclerotiorum]